MSAGEQGGTRRRLEDRLPQLATAHYLLTLFVTGASDLSVLAINNVRNLCETHLVGRYQLEVVDIHRAPSMMVAHGVVAAPTLLRRAPVPRRMLVGDLSDTDRVLAILDLPATTVAAEPEGRR